MKRINFWTPALDTEIKARRQRRESWRIIAKAMDKDQRTLIDRGRKGLMCPMEVSK